MPSGSGTNVGLRLLTVLTVALAVVVVGFLLLRGGGGDYTVTMTLANANQLVWASDWPHTGSSASRKDPLATEPFRQIDDRRVLSLVAAWTADPTVQRRILVDNAARFFGF